MILHNAPDELSKLLMNYFSNIINWSNKRLNVLNIIVTQKMGLFRYRSFHHDQHSEYNRHHTQHGIMNKVCCFKLNRYYFIFCCYFSIQLKVILLILNK